MAVSLAFHASLELPESAQALVGRTLALQPEWTVRDLSLAIQELALQLGLGLRICALINPHRARALPPHEQASCHFSDGDRALILGDLQSQPFPALAAATTRPAGSPVPITIFTGFLGSGKTTVLNHLLSGQRDKKFAVIENEFGEVPIDNELLQTSAMGLAEQVVVMENGCMCCTVRGDLLGAFDAIRQQMETGSPLDAVLVETTGMADPVPIVRTLRQTPDIAKYFQLDGTITLVDCRTILDRLGEVADGKDDQERHSQIAFADKILLNKLDLVSDQEVAEVWERIRSYNAKAPIVPSVKGVVPAAELTSIGAYDMVRIEEEESEEIAHGHSHGHGHDECFEDHGEGHGHGHSDHGGSESVHEGHGGGHGGGHGHDASRHDSQIGSFSIVRKGMEVEPLAFARWVRVIATLPTEKGHLYRSKGILACRGKRRKLIFHAVADVTETSEGPEWGPNEPRVCKMVFIGKKLARKEIEERFLQVLQPLQGTLRPALTMPLLPESPSLVNLGQAGTLQRALLGLWSKDVLRLSQTSAALHDAIFSAEAHAGFQAAAADLPEKAPRGVQTMKGELWLHGLLPLNSVRQYAMSWKNGKLQLLMPSSVEHLFGAPMTFDTLADVEAAGVMWQELCEMNASGCINVVTEFKWKPETIKSFFDVPGSSTNSALMKVEVEDPSGDQELDDELKFRVNLVPESSEEAGTGAMKNLHRMSLQLVGGKSSSKVYQIFFHTVDPTYQVHINVPDHRQPIFPTNEVFHQWHPVMAGLKKRPRLRFLIRLKPMDSGPLDAMCGCCG